MKLIDLKMRTRGVLNKFRRNTEGVSTVEFALLVPLLLIMYLGSVEVSSLLSMDTRNARVSSTVADLVTQQETLTRSDLDAILNIGAAIMYPYTRTKPKITIVGVRISHHYPKGGRIVWSREIDQNGTYTAGMGLGRNTDYTVPDKLIQDGTFLIKVMSEIDFKPLVQFMEDGSGKITSFPIESSYWLRPRESDEVACSNC